MMDELLKAKYYNQVSNTDYAHYEMVGNVLAALENKMINSSNIIAIQDLVSTIEPIKDTEKEVYDELKSDLENGVIGGEENNGR